MAGKNVRRHRPCTRAEPMVPHVEDPAWAAPLAALWPALDVAGLLEFAQVVSGEELIAELTATAFSADPAK